ncbi:unnamed protein product [Psylliodes chrysocephalus]|uniref:Multidrug resistance-associated protein lethal(2)03659 n=1 Tax=Psylliodes chrysocephalus TaxID=3402493 RepID=A0A9P0CL50_9CUCU|nr:unnamed protein product [Psylliodes chrysocephala]
MTLSIVDFLKSRFKKASDKRTGFKKSEKMRPEADDRRDRRDCPRAHANFLSAFTFFYSIRTFRDGVRRELTEDDLTKPLDEHKSKILGDKISQIWTKEYDRAMENKRRPSMCRVIFKTFYKEFLVYGLIMFVLEVGIRLFQPIFVGCFIKYFNDINKNNTSPPRPPQYFERVINFWQPNQGVITQSEAYFFAGGIALCNYIVVMVTHPYMLAVLHVGMKVRVACCSLIYRKALRLKFTSLGGQTVGNVVNLMSNDVTRFDLAPIFVHYLWISPIQLTFILYFMYKEVQEAALVGITAVFGVIPIQMLFGVRSATLRRRAGARTDERVRQMNEIIQSIQVIKMYAWEKAFAALIKELRRKELKVLRQTSYIRGMIMSFIMFTSRSAIFLTVISYMLLGNHISAEKVFLIISYYQILRQTMTVYFPQGVAMVAEGTVSVHRIEEFMCSEETNIGDPTPIDKLWRNKPRKYPKRPADAAFRGDAYLQITHGISKYGDVLCLEDINLEFQPGQLIAVVGPVGAGKSCLLHLIMGELPLFSGRLNVRGVVSYASQEAWLFVGSVRQNILFGRHFEYHRYREIIKVCALTRDFSILPFGDRTIVGERGVSLSGGQRARVNLARCVYKEADIYLLDDPLSAVDIQVGQQLFEACIKRYLKDKIVILITHQLQYLKRADYIVIMNEGIIQCQGPYQGLMEQPDLSHFATILKEASTASPIEEKEVEKLLRGISVTSAVFNSMIDIEGKKRRPLIIPEMRTTGSVDFANYKSYFRAGANTCGIICMIILFLSAQIIGSGGDYFLAQWVNVEELRFHKGSAESMGIYNELNRDQCIIIYNIFMIFTILVAIIRSLIYYTICMRSSQRLHNRMFESIIHACLMFFNSNSSGRILNRFSKDLGAVDELLPNAFCDTTQLLLNLIGAIIVVSMVEPMLLVPTFLMLISFYFLRRVYLATSRNVKRLEGITRSPVFAHLNASLQGLTTIRSNGAEQILVDEFDALQDIHSSAWYMFLYTSRAFGLWLDLICTTYIGFVSISFIVLAEDYYGSAVGLAITQCIGLSGLVQWGMRQSAELENQMTSVERVLEFTKIEHEPDLESTPDKKPPSSWPKYGKIEFNDCSMRYSYFEPPVLKHLSFVVKPKEKIGIVGRTGAGKSSMIGTIFRLGHYDGLILIDNLDISVLGLHDLRRKLSIIPQEPVLFSGTLRYNLDPFNEYTDEQIFSALMDVEIANAVKKGINCLDDIMREGGTNISVGSRQMVCLARAILRNNIILVMDEATANVDAQTDRFIQTTIRTKFAHCTVLTIAHRLNTVMDYDKILVLDAGQLIEFDHPHILLQNKDGVLSDMVRKTGPGVSDRLRDIAKDNYNRKMFSEKAVIVNQIIQQVLDLVELTEVKRGLQPDIGILK